MSRKHKHIADIFPEGFQVEISDKLDSDSADDQLLSEMFDCDVKRYDYKQVQTQLMSAVIFECYNQDMSLKELSQKVNISIDTIIDMLNCKADLDLFSISKFETQLKIQLINIPSNPEENI
jgi:hypothetical protein